LILLIETFVYSILLYDISPSEILFFEKEKHWGYATIIGKLNTPKDEQSCPSKENDEIAPDCLPGIS
jgi:hypothetical protein